MLKIATTLILLILLIQTSLSQSNYADSLSHQNFQRKFMVHLPPNFSLDTKRPLVINLHGGSGNMVSAQGFSLFNPSADKYDYVVAWPQGYGIAAPGYSWADGRNTSADQLGVDDVGFINKLIDSLILRHNIDTNRIYICGFSNGGFMVQRIACELAERFAAMASLGSSMDTVLYKKCTPTKSIPMAFFNGTSDPAMPYYGGSLQNPQVIPVVPVDSTVKFWVRQNKCKNSEQVYNFANISTIDSSTAELYKFNNCDCDANVYFYKLINGGHTWPGVYVASQASVLGNTNRDINASEELLKFFSSFTLCNSINSVKEETKIDDIAIFPNPVNNFINLQLNENKEVKIEIQNILGQTVISAINKKSLDLTNLDNGVYIIIIQVEKSTKSQLFIKQ